MDAEVGLGAKHQSGKQRASEWGRWEGSAQGAGERVAPGCGDEVVPLLLHSPVSGVAQPLPVWCPGHRPGSSAPPVLEGDLGAQGEKQPGKVKASSAPLLPSAQQCLPACPGHVPPSHSRVKQGQAELPNAHCRALLPTQHSPSHAPHTGSPPWPAAARSTAPCARGRAADPLSPSVRGSGFPLTAVGSAGGGDGAARAPLGLQG